MRVLFFFLCLGCTALAAQIFPFAQGISVHSAANAIPYGSGFLYASSGMIAGEANVGTLLYRFQNKSQVQPDTFYHFASDSGSFLIAPACILRYSPNGLLVLCTDYPVQGNSRGVVLMLNNDLVEVARYTVAVPGRNVIVQWGIVASDERIYMSGTITQEDGLANDVYVACIDTLGNVLWDRSIGGAGNEKGHKIVQGGDGLLYINADSEQGSYMNALYSLDLAGELRWQQFAGDANVNGTQFVIWHRHSGNLWLCGESTTSQGASFDVFLAEISSSGDVLRTAYLGGGGTEAAMAMKEMGEDGEVFLCGYTNSYDSTQTISPFLAVIQPTWDSVGVDFYAFQEVSIGKDFHIETSGSYVFAEAQSVHLKIHAALPLYSDSRFRFKEVILGGLVNDFQPFIRVDYPNGGIRFSKYDMRGYTLTVFDMSGRVLARYSGEGNTPLVHMPSNGDVFPLIWEYQTGDKIMRGKWSRGF